MQNMRRWLLLVAAPLLTFVACSSGDTGLVPTVVDVTLVGTGGLQATREEICDSIPEENCSTYDFGIGERLRVAVSGGDQLFLRAEASHDSELVAELPDGTLVTVLDGPQVADDLVRWLVEADDGRSGWAVEAVDNEDTLVPLPILIDLKGNPGNVLVSGSQANEAQLLDVGHEISVDSGGEATILWPDRESITVLQSGTVVEIIDASRFAEDSAANIGVLASPVLTRHERPGLFGFGQKVGRTFNDHVRRIKGLFGRSRMIVNSGTVYTVTMDEFEGLVALEVQLGEVEVASMVDGETLTLTVGAGDGATLVENLPPFPGTPDQIDLRPDLVVADLQLLGEARENAKGEFAVPVRVEVLNQGASVASSFGVFIVFTSAEGTSEAPFAVPVREAFTEAGQRVEFEGNVTLPPDVAGEMVVMIAIADGCRLEELRSGPEFCRVDESNEGNNGSASIEVGVPESLIQEPDLEFTEIEALGDAVVIDGSFWAPIRVQIRNRGNAPADIFKVSVEYSVDGEGAFFGPFDAEGQAKTYPFTSTLLGPGEVVEFEGNVRLARAIAGLSVGLVAIADSCSGDEFMPEFCRVDESDESNNRSQTLSVTIPFTLQAFCCVTSVAPTPTP